MLHVGIDGLIVTGSLSVPNSGAWQTWRTITRTGINLTAGQHVVKVSFDTNAGSGAAANLNRFRFTSSTPTAPATPTGLTSDSSNGQTALSRNAFRGATRYDIYRSTTSGGAGRAEIWWTGARSRPFNVKINDAQVRTNFDIFAAAGGKDIPIVRASTALADAGGTLAIPFNTVPDNASLIGIEIFAP
jgi:hypothetical protein